MTDGLLFDGPLLWARVLGTGELDGPIVRAAGAGVCRRCRGFLILGLDSDRCALDAKADAEPVSALGEAQALVLGLRTYDLGRTKGAWHLEWRDAGAIRTRPPGQVDVLAEHRCGSNLDRTDPRHAPVVAVTNATPPF